MRGGWTAACGRPRRRLAELGRVRVGLRVRVRVGLRVRVRVRVRVRPRVRVRVRVEEFGQLHVVIRAVD